MDRSYCFLGDSVTQAAYIKNGWVNQIREYLELKYQDEFVNVYNLGIGGNTTEDLLDRIDELKARNPTHIIIVIGVNDTRYLQGQELEADQERRFVDNMELIIKISKEYSGNLLIVGLVIGDDSQLQPLPDGDGHCYNQERVELFNSRLKELASRHTIPFVDLLATLQANDFSDGLHPNQQGHNKIFGEIRRFI
ncbi:MAG: SGNH/GDSL hydrolase family protein [Candidatus Shapirobacteria bacterium]|jgi:lysophospholipase L1-like esterase